MYHNYHYEKENLYVHLKSYPEKEEISDKIQYKFMKKNLSELEK